MRLTPGKLCFVVLVNSGLGDGVTKEVSIGSRGLRKTSLKPSLAEDFNQQLSISH